MLPLREHTSSTPFMFFSLFQIVHKKESLLRLFSAYNLVYHILTKPSANFVRPAISNTEWITLVWGAFRTCLRSLIDHFKAPTAAQNRYSANWEDGN